MTKRSTSTLRPARTAAVIINYRTPILVQQCLASLKGELVPGRDVAVVVDNASGDGSAAAIEAWIEAQGLADRATVVRSPNNGGFSAGNNLGMRAAPAARYLLINSDCVLRPGALAGLHASLDAHPDVGAVGPRLFNAGGARSNSAFRFKSPLSEFVEACNLGPVTRLLQRWTVALPVTEAAQRPEWVSFACVMLRATAVDDVGPLDEGFFLYYEDMDYCRTLRCAGWDILQLPAAEVVHLEGASTGLADTIAREQRRPRYYYAARARYFAKRYGRLGLWYTNSLATAGHFVSWLRPLFGKPIGNCRRTLTDNWIGSLHPLRATPDDRQD